MKRVTRHLSLERRRLSLIAALAFASGFTLYSHIEATRFGLPVPVVIGLIYMAVIVCATALSTYFLPGLRRVTDTVAMTRLAFALWVAGTQSHEIAASPTISAAIVVGGAIFVLQTGSLVQKLAGNRPDFGFVPHIVGNTRLFLAWLDNACEYQGARVQPVFAGKTPRTVV
ncbi:hypothetical protein [Ruegeria faecimaris]|uniref:hypothetical protein n=1 Tax=Ruegeria faecimaris TaxID=686389 RepID=UPI00233116D8|nr:hypothetical protein [Ruegeria faecimaris]